MHTYKIVLNGQGGYFFCSLVNSSIINYWLENKSFQLLQEYILAHYLNDDNIDEEWRIPEKFRFNIFNNINSLCLWESDSIELNNATICDIYKINTSNNFFTFMQENEFNKQKLVDSFICTDQMIYKNKNNWLDIIYEGLDKKNVSKGYLIYFKANARGYATHDEILNLDEPIDKKNLKFSTSTFGIKDLSSNVIKKALYYPNTTKEKVLYDFQMLKDAREKPDFDFTGLQEVIIKDNKLETKLIL